MAKSSKRKADGKKMHKKKVKKAKKSKGNKSKQVKVKGDKKIDKRIRMYVNAGRGKGHYKKLWTDWKYASEGTDNARNRQGIYSFGHCMPLQLLDAVSVLFNGKTAAQDFNILTNNFSGDPDFTMSSVVTTYTVTNVSQIPVTLELYGLECKQDTNKSPYQAWTDTINEDLSPPTPIVYPYWYNMKPEDTPGEFGRYWSGTKKRKTVTIEPGKTKEVYKFVTGFQDINWEDMQVGNTVLSYKKGVSKVLLVVHKIPPCRLTSITNGDAVTVATGSGSSYYGGLCWQVEENYKTVCPQVATEAYNKDTFTLLHDYASYEGVFIYPSKPTVRNVYQNDWLAPPTGGVENTYDTGIAS